jgi:hypothetical protein
MDVYSSRSVSSTPVLIFLYQSEHLFRFDRLQTSKVAHRNIMFLWLSMRLPSRNSQTLQFFVRGALLEVMKTSDQAHVVIGVQCKPMRFPGRAADRPEAGGICAVWE